jgi:hypothetical protein
MNIQRVTKTQRIMKIPRVMNIKRVYRPKTIIDRQFLVNLILILQTINHVFLEISKTRMPSRLDQV